MLQTRASSCRLMRCFRLSKLGCTKVENWLTAGERGASMRAQDGESPLQLGDVDWQRRDRLLLAPGEGGAVRHYGQGVGCLQVADDASE